MGGFWEDYKKCKTFMCDNLKPLEIVSYFDRYYHQLRIYNKYENLIFKKALI